MKLKRILTLTAAAALTTALLTGCPWEQDDAASSEPSSSSSSPSRPSHDSDSGDDDTETPEEPDEGGEDESEQPQEGYDEATNTYTVTSEEGLRDFAAMVNGEDTDVNCTLAGNITLTDEWTPIGDKDKNTYGYTGTFDGGGYTITGLKVSSGKYIGLFALVNSGGVVKNLHLAGVTLSGSWYAGGVAGWSEGTILGCTVSAGRVTASGASASAGGIVGSNDGDVIGCMVSGEMKGSRGSDTSPPYGNAGGIVGYNMGAITGCCFVGGSVTADDHAGGVVGLERIFDSNSSIITDCYWQAGTDGSPSAGVGEGDNEDNCHKVTGDWKDAIEAMNDAIAKWNTAHPENHCNVTYTLGAGGKPAWGSGTTLQAVLKMFGL